MNTVTISLEDYESLKKEISSLKEQVKQKTIIEYSVHPYLGNAIIIFACANLLVFVVWVLPTLIP